MLKYIPTAFATFLEPVWVLLNRLLCILQPFEELRRDARKPAASLDLKYTSLPPPLIVWRALRARHLVLSSVCIVALLANPLAISLSGLFEVNTVMTEQGQSFSTRYVPIFDGGIYGTVGSDQNFPRDHFYVQRANLSNGAYLPPWVTPEFYFLPSDLSTPAETGLIFETPTRGFGIDSKCQKFGQDEADNRIYFAVSRDGGTLNVTSSHQLPEGGYATCVANTLLRNDSGRSISNGDIESTLPVGPGPQSLDLAAGMIAKDNDTASPDQRAFCEGLLLLGWVRATFVPSAQNRTTMRAENVDARIMTCRPVLRTAEFLVNTTSTGRVLSYTQTTSFDPDVAKYFGAINANYLYSSANAAITEGPGVQSWNNETLISDWMNFFIKLSLNSTALGDPLSPLPPYEFLSPLVQSINRSLFAILLSIHPQVFPARSASTPPVQGKIYTLQPRVFMSNVMFIISITILTLNLVVAMLYYVRRPKKFLPRMPTSIASVIAFIAASHAVEDFRAGVERRGENRYRYGKFNGTDGKPHVGIEKRVLVVPLETEGLLKRKRTRSRS